MILRGWNCSTNFAPNSTARRRKPRLQAAPNDGTTLPFFEVISPISSRDRNLPSTKRSDIVFNNRIPNARPQDAHDVLGTFRIVA